MTETREQIEFEPLVEELRGVSAVEAFKRLAHLPHVAFLDSAVAGDSAGRYSFVAADPVRWIELDGETLRRVPAAVVDPRACATDDGAAPRIHRDPFFEISEIVVDHPAKTIAGLPPFQGGVAGLFSYELAQRVERIPAAAHDEFRTPHLAVGLYDVVLAFDHARDRAWIISQGIPERTRAARRDRAAMRITEMRTHLSSHARGHAAAGRSEKRSETHGALPRTKICRQFATDFSANLTSNFSRDGYLRAVDRIIEYIHAGDVFQVNLSQRLLHPATDDSVSLYLRLRERNAAPFAGYLDTGRSQILSASPERFLWSRDGDVETRPIKGTRRRTLRPEADLFSGDDLVGSEKDRAENIMIVDLLRNDLSRVCDADSVRVSQLCELKSYAYVQHLVSTVHGRLRTSCTPVDLLRASFPGGSITGAPKIRAMEIIAELEPTARGAYCGSLGYIGLDGAMDTNILIRTITACDGWWQAPVGGGVIAESDPSREYEETWHKAEGLLRALS